LWTTGKLLEVDITVKGVLLEIQNLDPLGEAQPSDKTPSLLITAFLKFMSVTCALWMEVACRVSLNTDICTHSLTPLPPLTSIVYLPFLAQPKIIRDNDMSCTVPRPARP
jgi:hypothetical protein